MIKSKKYFSVGITIIGLLLVSILCFAMFEVEPTYAQSTSKELSQDVYEKCEDFTDSIFLYGDNSSNLSLIGYENYINERFEINKIYTKNSNIVDEWIFRIIPEELFEQKVENFLYIGAEYGFYIDYDSVDDMYFVYYLLHTVITVGESGGGGYLSSEIRPLYYEKYVYTPSTEPNGQGKASLKYSENQFPGNYYKKYSYEKNVYLKDVSFSGSLYNENNFNEGESRYNSDLDKGAYFVRNNYKFNGVSIKNKKKDLEVDFIKTGVGFLSPSSDEIGKAVSAHQLADSFLNFAGGTQSDFSGNVKNETNYVDKIHDTFLEPGDVLLKNAGVLVESGYTDDTLIFGIEDNCYIRNMFYYNYADRDRYNSRFAESIGFEIVEEIEKNNNSVLKTVAFAETNKDYLYSIDVGQSAVIDLTDDANLYVLNEATHNVIFNVPENGIYTFETFGNIKNKFDIDSDNIVQIDDKVDGKNQKISLRLEKGETLNLVSKNISGSNGTYLIEAFFTPEIIGIGVKEDITIQPNEREFYRFQSVGGIKAFDFSIVTQHNITVDIYDTSLSHYEYDITGANPHGSIFTPNEMYFIGIRNNTLESIAVDLQLANIKSTEPNEVCNLDVITRKIIEITTPYTAGVSISFDSLASIYMKLYNENNTLASSSTASSPSIYIELLKNNKYYLLIENYDHTDSDVNISVEWDAYNVDFGDNSISNVSIDEMFIYENRSLNAEYNVSANFDFEIYDTDFNLLTEISSGLYTFVSNEDYYILSQDNQSAGNITIALDYTEETSGIYPSSGVRYIKYIPTTTYGYNVNISSITDSTYTLYTQSLNESSTYLYAGSTYYLRIEGNPLEQYDISIIMNRHQIVIGRITNVLTGYYYINVAEEDTYSFRTYRSNNISSTISIYDSSGNAITNAGQLTENINADDTAYQVSLPVGLYYIDLNVNTTGIRVGIHIIKTN